ncbi:MAG: 60S ribosomal protein L38 [Marteilia pararefringens]
MAREISQPKDFVEKMSSMHAKSLKYIEINGMHKFKLRVGRKLFTYTVKCTEKAQMLRKAVPPHVNTVTL